MAKITLLWIALWALPASGAAAQLCPDNATPVRSTGVQAYECRSSACWLNRPDGTGRRHEFLVEPVLHVLAGHSVLREGDVLVSVEGHLITTVEAGRILAAPGPRESLRLVVRRSPLGLVELDAPLIPTCQPPRLIVRGGARVEGGD